MKRLRMLQDQPRRIVRTVVPAVVALLAAGLAISSASGAGSGGGGLNYPPAVVKAVPDASVNGDGITSGHVDCPQSHPETTGGGVQITGSDPKLDLEIHSTFPQLFGGWTSKANNSTGFQAHMTVYAICSTGSFKHPFNPVDVAPDSSRAAHVACPAGTKVSGGGVELLGGDHSVEVGTSAPSDGPDANNKPDDAWSGTGNNGTGGSVEMHVFAVCAKRGDYRVVESDRTPIPDNGSASAEVRCPAGSKVTGGGVDIRGVDPNLEVNSSFPTDGGDVGFTPDNGWQGIAYNDGTGNTDHMSTFAVCKHA